MRTPTVSHALLPLLALAHAMTARAQDAPAAGAAGGAPVPPAELGRSYTAWLYEGHADSLWARFAPPMRELFGGRVSGLRAFRDQALSELGRELRVEDERSRDLGGWHEYTRTARFELHGAPVVIQWTLDVDGVVGGLLIRPAAAGEADGAAPSRRLDYRTAAELRLPFEGEWLVFWGGRSVADNYHAVDRGQRFAYDFLVVREGRSYAGDGRRNEDYHCFGAPVLAPAAGTVAAASDGAPDNAPGVMDPAHPLGNHVVIDHGGGEFSFLAHLRRGSVAAAAGERVAAGQPLGACGNSGNSSEPHLHYHLQSTPDFGRGEGLPAQFRRYLAGGRLVERGEPVRGERVEQRGQKE